MPYSHHVVISISVVDPFELTLYYFSKHAQKSQNIDGLAF